MERFEEITDGLYLLKVPFGPVWTGVVLVRGEETCLIDSGPTPQAAERYVLPALRELGIGPGEIRWLLNTHSHGDHIGGLRYLQQALAAQTAVLAPGEAKLRDPAAFAVRIRTEFPENSPPPQSTLQSAVVDRILKDGETVGDRLRVISTPGHDDDCVCWYDTATQTLITGDSLQGNGTICQGVAFYQDCPGYLRSLERLRLLAAENILCGHEYDGLGWLIRGKEAVSEGLNACLCVPGRYAAFLEERFRRGERDLAKLSRELIDALGCGTPEHLFMAMYTVRQHLLQWKEENA